MSRATGLFRDRLPAEAARLAPDPARRVHVADDDRRAPVGELGQELFPPEQLTPEALAARQAAEIERWWPVIKAANIKAQ